MIYFSSDDEDFEVVLTQFRSPPSNKKKPRQPSPGVQIVNDSMGKKGNDYWAEVYIENVESWICVDCVRNRVYHTSEMEEHTTKPMRYVLAYDNGRQP